MKLTIEAEEHTASVEFEHYDLHEFSHYLRGLLHTVWHPSQVDSIMPTEESLSDEFAEVRKLGYEEGYEAGLAKAKDNHEQPTVTDTKRLDFLLNHAYAIQLNPGDILSSREKIDKQMEESL